MGGIDIMDPSRTDCRHVRVEISRNKAQVYINSRNKAQVHMNSVTEAKTVTVQDRALQDGISYTFFTTSTLMNTKKIAPQLQP